MATEEARRSSVERVQVEGLVTQGRRRDDARLSSLEEGLEDMKLVVGRLSEKYEELVQESSEITAVAKEMIMELGRTTGEEVRSLTQEVADLRKFVEGELHDLRKEVDDIRKECRASHGANGEASTSTSVAARSMNGLKIPKPDTYDGTRSAIIVDNFLFGLEQYFDALNVIERWSQNSQCAQLPARGSLVMVA